MNILFALIFLSCAFLLLCTSPNAFLTALLGGASKAATLCVSLLATYSVWMGLMKIWEDSRIAKGIAKLLKPAAKRLLQTENDEALESASMSFAVNMLGISGAATPYGVKTAQLLDKTENAEYSSAVFFAMNATSLQILPSSLVAVRMSMGSAAPMDILIPTLLTSFFSTLLAVLLTKLFIHPNQKLDFSKKQPLARQAFLSENLKMTGAGTR